MDKENELSTPSVPQGEEQKHLEKIQKYSIEDFKAFSYFFNGKRDTIIKLFDENKKIEFGDVKELFKKIEGKLQTHYLVTNQLGITISLSDGNIKDYSNFQVFIDDDWRIKEKSESLLFEWEFTLNHPKFPFPQKHTVKLRIGSSLRPDEMFKLMMSGSEDHEIEEAAAQIVLRIDFINHSISNDIKNAIKNWYDALPISQTQSGIVNFLAKTKNLLGTTISLLAGITGFGIIAFFTFAYLDEALTTKEQIKILFLSIGTLLIGIGLSSSIGKYYAKSMIEKTIERFRRTPFLILTKGDENVIIERTQKNNQFVKQLFMKLSVALVFMIGSWIFGSFAKVIISFFNK